MSRLGPWAPTTPDERIDRIESVLELRQLVLLDQLQDPFDVVEFQSASEYRVPSAARQHFRPRYRHQHVVFETGAADPLHVRSGLDREHHARFEQQIRLPCGGPADARFLVDL